MGTARVFVSHSHEDKDFCDALVRALRAAGANVWYDEHGGAGHLMRTIMQELSSRPVFMVVLSKAAFASEWVREECEWAYGLWRSQQAERTILPITAQPIEQEDFNKVLFLVNFKRIEAEYKPLPQEEAIRQTLYALRMVPTIPFGLTPIRQSPPPPPGTVERGLPGTRAPTVVTKGDLTSHIAGGPQAFMPLRHDDRNDPYPHRIEIGYRDRFGWTVVGSSRYGLSAERENRYREDAIAVDMYNGWHLIAVADGGSAYRLARVGSNVAASAAILGMRSKIKTFERRSFARDALQDALTEVMLQGLSRASEAVEAEALSRSISLEDLSTTLLLLAHRELAHGLQLVAVAQVGDGIIVAGNCNGRLRWLAVPDTGAEGDDTLFLQDISPVEWRQRIHVGVLESETYHFLIMTDGVADDFLPIDDNLYRLENALFAHVLVHDNPYVAAETLTRLLSYDRPLSFGDRTLTCLYKVKGEPPHDTTNHTDLVGSTTGAIS